MDPGTPVVAIEEYRRAWRLREETRLAALRQLVSEARMEADRLADMLVREYGATRVILFGSVARGDPQRTDFDIDLAVEGIPPARRYDAGGAARLAASRRIEIVDLVAAHGTLRCRILQEGIVLRG